jgi:hypothetical protein
MKKSMQTNELIKLWKELNIRECIMEFNCGGDSMGEVSYVLYDNNNQMVDNPELTDHFESEVYKQVEFYEVSDGNYMGEYGQVIITLEEDDEDENGGYFSYDKQATAEWEDTFSSEVKVELTEQELDVIKKIENINYTSWDATPNVNYKEDCVITDEEEVILDKLLEKFKTEAEDAEIEGKGDENGDERNYETDCELEEGLLILNVSGRFYYTEESFD